MTNGLFLEFENGLHLSTRWGYCNYCEHYDNPTEDKHGFGVQKNGSKDVEFMFVKGDEKLIEKLCKKFGNDDNPSGYIKMEKWLDMLAYINRLIKRNKKKAKS